jgi:hypothetical protein
VTGGGGGRATAGVAVNVVARRAITVGDGRSTEALVEAGAYGYAHSCMTSDDFPARHAGGPVARVIALVEVDREATAREILDGAAALGLAPPTYEDALYFGIEHPDVQRERPVVFLHDPWLGHFGRRDVLCLWTNAGRRELGLEDFDGAFSPACLFAFVARPADGGRAGGPGPRAPGPPPAGA